MPSQSIASSVSCLSTLSIAHRSEPSGTVGIVLRTTTPVGDTSASAGACDKSGVDIKIWHIQKKRNVGGMGCRTQTTTSMQEQHQACFDLNSKRKPTHQTTPEKWFVMGLGHLDSDLSQATKARS